MSEERASSLPLKGQRACSACLPVTCGCPLTFHCFSTEWAAPLWLPTNPSAAKSSVVRPEKPVALVRASDVVPLIDRSSSPAKACGDQDGRQAGRRAVVRSQE